MSISANSCTSVKASILECSSENGLPDFQEEGLLLPPLILFFFFFFFCLLDISWAAPTAYGGSQARGLIRAVATSLCQSHSNAGSQLHLRPTPQLTATPDP